VIENSLELRTEKLYDAIESCSIPVYVGPDVEDGIPRGLYMQAEPTLSKVLAAMESAMHIDIEQWKTARDNWMKTESYLNSDTERFNQLLRELSDHFEIAER
jgi:enamine deaminase RidA (YjgF/YER057c/UK114 family)